MILTSNLEGFGEKTMQSSEENKKRKAGGI